MRKLHGADGRDIAKLVASEIGAVILLAAIIGLPPAAIATQRYLAGVVEHAPMGLWTLFIVLAVTLATAVLAVARHTWVAMTLKPIGGLVGKVDYRLDITMKGATRMATKTAVSSGTEPEESPSRLIDAKIKALGDWRGETLAYVRALIKRAVPDVVETVKWRGVPVWEHDGIICTGETYKVAVKLTFAKGAALDDPARLFNASLEGNTRRAIDIPEGAAIHEAAFMALVRAAVGLNGSKPAKKSPAK